MAIAIKSSALGTIEDVRQATGVEDSFEALNAYLQKATTAADLATAGAFIAPVVSSELDPEQTEQLRARYSVLRASLQNVVKMRELDGEEVTLTRPARYVRTANGPSFYLVGKRADGRDFETWAPRHGVARWLEGLRVADYPVRCVFALEPHPKDATKTMWTVTELAPPRERRNGGSAPF
jgi:hypothetical protein